MATVLRGSDNFDSNLAATTTDIDNAARKRITGDDWNFWKSDSYTIKLTIDGSTRTVSDSYNAPTVNCDCCNNS